jgi:hypothetical protein
MSHNIGINVTIRVHKAKFDDDTFHEHEKVSARRNIAGHNSCFVWGFKTTAACRQAFTYLYVESNDFGCDNNHLHIIAKNHGKSEGEENKLESVSDDDVELFGVHFLLPAL